MVHTISYYFSSRNTVIILVLVSMTIMCSPEIILRNKLSDIATFIVERGMTKAQALAKFEEAYDLYGHESVMQKLDKDYNNV